MPLFAKGSTSYPPVRSPWGAVDYRTEIGRGIWSVGTASHGGLWLEPSAQALMPEPCRQPTPYSACPEWFEEDCDCLLVYARFPETVAEHYSRERLAELLNRERKYFGDARVDALLPFLTSEVSANGR